jgi:hypothetical protein
MKPNHVTAPGASCALCSHSRSYWRGPGEFCRWKYQSVLISMAMPRSFGSLEETAITFVLIGW